jgi:hypothetical protein
MWRMAKRGERSDAGDAPELALLLLLLRWPAVVDAVQAYLDAHAVSWPAVVALARRHRVTTLVAKTLREAIEAGGTMCGNDCREAAALLDARARQLAVARFAQIGEAARVTRLLATEGIGCLHLKGAPLAVRAFNDVATRDSRDIDILVETKHAERVDGILVKAGSQRQKPVSRLAALPRTLHMRYAHEYVYTSAAGLTVEIKTRLQPARGLLPLDAGDLMRRATEVEVAGICFPVLPEADEFMYLCVHGARHVWYRLKWLADIAALLANCEDPLAVETVEVARRLGVLVPVLEGFDLAHSWLGAPVPGEIIAQARSNAAVKRRRPVIEGAAFDPVLPRAVSDRAHIDADWIGAECRLRPELSYRWGVLERAAAGRIRAAIRSA